MSEKEGDWFFVMRGISIRENAIKQGRILSRFIRLINRFRFMSRAFGGVMCGILKIMGEALIFLVHFFRSLKTSIARSQN